MFDRFQLPRITQNCVLFFQHHHETFHVATNLLLCIINFQILSCAVAPLTLATYLGHSQGGTPARVSAETLTWRSGGVCTLPLAITHSARAPYSNRFAKPMQMKVHHTESGNLKSIYSSERKHLLYSCDLCSLPKQSVLFVVTKFIIYMFLFTNNFSTIAHPNS